MSNSLSAVHPELVAEWSDRNLPLTPDSITFGSNKKVWWKGACGHEWETSVKARSNGEKCPICSGARVVTGINDLSTLKPELASEWSEKNKIKPTEVSIGSHKKVIWKCKLGHKWIATVKSRTINKTGCPYCSHNKVLVGFNDLVLVMNLSAWFFAYKENRGEHDIDNLWDLLEKAIAYSDEASTDNKNAFISAYDTVTKQKMIKWNITMGLYWARPYTFINLDSTNRAFITDVDNMGYPADHACLRSCKR